MSVDPKPSIPTHASHKSEKGVTIFTYPKIIFIFPTFLTALFCSIVMFMMGDPTADPIREARAANAKAAKAAEKAGGEAPPVVETVRVPTRHERFDTTQNLLGELFLCVFAVNLLVMAVDFPRFTIVGLVFFLLFGIFLVLWIGAFFEVNILKSVRAVFGGVYAVANSGFYFLIFLGIGVTYCVIFVTRYLDYWQILPNEILHHHGPLSDLERYPTTNLKFDKEIPDVIEHLLLGAGRITLHLPSERKSIVLDNVLFIGRAEEKLKSLMSRMEVRVTTDREVADI